MRDPEYNDKRDFYEAMIIMHEAAKKYIERYAELCMQKAAEETDTQRRKELELMADNCRQIAGGAPQTAEGEQYIKSHDGDGAASAGDGGSTGEKET